MQFEEADQIALAVARDMTLSHRSFVPEVPRLAWRAVAAHFERRQVAKTSPPMLESFLAWTEGTDAAALFCSTGGILALGGAIMPPWRKRSGIVPNVGVGVSVGPTPDSWRVAIRAWSEADLQTPALERVHNLPRSEVDIRITGVIRPQTGPSSVPNFRRRPIVVGCSIGHHQLPGAGTLGAFVRHTDGSLLMLSCNHVLVEGNRRSQNDTILQPGLGDGGQILKDVAGQLKDFVPLRTDDNVVDAAVATIDNAVQPDDLAVPGIGPVHRYCLPEELLDLSRQHAPVYKVGRSTGSTSGTLNGYIRDLPVDYSGVKRWFGAVFEVLSSDPSQPFSTDGDSGSLVIDNSGIAVGIIFSGDKDASYLSSIAQIFKALPVSF